MKHTTYNEEKKYFEIVEDNYRSFSSKINWGMKTENGKIIIPVGRYTSEEIRMAEWELCVSFDKKYEITGHIASIPNWTVVKEIKEKA